MYYLIYIYTYFSTTPKATITTNLEVQILLQHRSTNTCTCVVYIQVVGQ